MKKKILIIAAGLLLAPVILVEHLLFAEMIIVKANDHAAAFVVDKLLEAPLPENTEIIETFYSGCNYGKYIKDAPSAGSFGGMLIKTDLNYEELDEYYDDYRISQHLSDFIIKKQKDEVFEVDCVKHRFRNEFDDGNYFVVYSETLSGAPYHLPYDYRGLD